MLTLLCCYMIYKPAKTRNNDYAAFTFYNID